MRAQKQKAIIDPITSAIITVSHKAMVRIGANSATNFVIKFLKDEFTLRRCASGHKLDIQRCKGRVTSQIATLLERAAWLERSLHRAGSLERVP